MKKRIGIILVCILFIGINFLPIISITNKANNTNIVYVDDDADPTWYNAIHVRTIQEGVNNASAGDTVYVYNGTYIGFIAEKEINFIGENNQNTVINVLWSNERIQLKSDHINFSNFKITGRYIGFDNPLLGAIGNDIIISNCNV